MKPTLQFKLSQHLALTPQLQQAIRLLQLSTVELNQEIERIVQENPLLELDDSIGSDVTEYRPNLLDSSVEPLAPDLLEASGDTMAEMPATESDSGTKNGMADESDWAGDDGTFRSTRDEDEEREFPQQSPPVYVSILTCNSA